MTDLDNTPPEVADEQVPAPISTVAEFDEIVMRLSWLEGRAEKIANIICSRNASFLRFEDGPEGGRVVYSFNNACSCHPEEDSDSFPGAYLFDEKWEENYRSEQQRKADAAAKAQEAADARAAAAIARKRESDERRTYERLREKYEGGGQ